MTGRLRIPFFTDHCVPDSVGRVLMEAGHTVTRLRDVMPMRTADPVIAVACSQSGHVLVSHDKDFRQIAKRLNVTQRMYREQLHRIQLRCPEPISAQRIRDALALIELEWALVTTTRPMVIEISQSSIYTQR